MHAAQSANSTGTRMVDLHNTAIADNLGQLPLAEEPGKCTTVIGMGLPLNHQRPGNAY